MPVTKAKSAPYTSPGTVLDIIGRYRSRGLPVPINAEVLARAGIAESMIPRTLQALQVLDLIDDAGNPSETLEAIRLIPEAEYKRRLEDWLKSTYAEVFSFVDPSTDDESRIRDAFRGYQPIGQQARMVTLFQGLCTAAGLIPDKASTPRSAPRPQVIPRPRASTPSFVRAGIAKSPQNGGPLLRKYQVPPSSTDLPAPLAGLLQSLPDASNGWTLVDRNKFYSTFGTVLDFCIPILKTPHHQKETDGQE